MDDPNGFQACQSLPLHILIREANVQDPVVGPGGLAGPGCGPGARDGIALPSASRNGEDGAG